MRRPHFCRFNTQKGGRKNLGLIFAVDTVDYAEFEGNQFLVLVDATTKWPEVFFTKTTTASKTIEILSTVFSRMGLPCQIVSDNGPQFVAAEFASFCKANGIQHLRGAPYHPQSNGAAERLVQTVKKFLKTVRSQPGSLESKVAQFLLRYRVTPHPVTNRSPSSHLLGRNLRSRLDLLKPDKEVEKTTVEFQIGQSVVV